MVGINSAKHMNDDRLLLWADVKPLDSVDGIDLIMISIIDSGSEIVVGQAQGVYLQICKIIDNS